MASSVKLAGTVTMISGTDADAGNSNLQFENIRDGMGIKLGDETYVLALTDKTKNAKYGEGYKVIDLTDLVDPTRYLRSCWILPLAPTRSRL